MCPSPSLTRRGRVTVDKVAAGQVALLLAGADP